MQPNQNQLQILRDRIADHCVEIEDLFSLPVLVTCIVRRADNPEGDVLVTSEQNLDDIIALIQRSKPREVITEQSFPVVIR